MTNVFNATADTLRVRIYSTNKIDKLEVVQSFGTYYLGGSKSLKKQDKISLELKESKIAVFLNDSLLQTQDSVKISSKDLKCFFQINPVGLKSRRYDNDLLVKLDKDKKHLLLINIVDEDNYLAAVVQSEAGGASDNVEFFKVQAICCRSYMMRFKNKHAKDGYNLCDDVNCQVYLSRANKTECREGAVSSSGEIIVDSNDNIIETLFYSNSGGQTAKAKDVWGKDVSYLQSVTDSFSLGQPNATWEKDIKEKDWINYFRNKGIDVKNTDNKKEILNFSQKDGRKDKIFNIPLTQVRKDFNLKSTYFDVVRWGSIIKLKGRGYGHGVGMSQEGAAAMCDEGYEYWEVIDFYYKDVKIKNIKEE